MENQVIICIFVLFFFTFFFFGADAATTITVRNNCPATIWPAVTNSGQRETSTTGFELASGAWRSFVVSTPWTGRVWARTRCYTTNGRFSCLTGDCSSGRVACNGEGGVPPSTLAEFSIAINGGRDFYDLSLVDGFNLPVSITPQGGARSCASSNCVADVNAVCPPELQLKTSDGEVIGCKGACSAFNQPRFCCTGDFSDPDTCKPTAYSKFFKAQCPHAYSTPYDDEGSSFSCTNQPDYVVTFCKLDGINNISVCRGPIYLDISKVKIL